jgi:hypothetical protein
MGGRGGIHSLRCLSREYAPVVLIFGAWRDRRLQRTAEDDVATYGPAALIYVAVRLIRGCAIAGRRQHAADVHPQYGSVDRAVVPAFYVYFLLTIAGGVSLVLAAQPQRWWRVIREEPEWLGFAVPIILVTALVGIDIWRYLTALTPLIVVLFARCSQEWRPRQAMVLMSPSSC